MTLKIKNQLENEYYRWLVKQIAIPVNNRKTYHDLFQRLHETEFLWFLSGDDNRVQDARDLRAEFLDGRHHLFQQGISVLEVLIALSRHLAFLAGGSPAEWSWLLLENLTLNTASDPLEGRKAEKVDEILERLIWRTYERDGQGGFFPLNSTLGDQTKVEIWFQMQSYINEIDQL